jgi:hypothetical protein
MARPSPIPIRRDERSRPRALPVGMLMLIAAVVTVPARSSDTLEWNGFALLRPQTPAAVPLDDDSLSAQVQIGIDWRPSASVGGHLHLLARNQGDGSRRGRVGAVEAFLEESLTIGDDRVHLMEGAFFLPTSHENVDSLWENPYTISSSALNSWLGEELRPVGADVSYTHRLPRAGALTGGATLFAGNDTFGALPIDRGWTLSDDWALLGQHTPVSPAATSFTSVSAETDHRLGWSVRAKWNNDHGALQLTHIDNRADALKYGELHNWATRFNIAGADYTWHDWTAAAETGWGTTAIQGARARFSFDIRSSYLLLSRKIASLRATARADEFENGTEHGYALTAALFWEPRGRLRSGIEAITAKGQKRLALELRYRF